MGINCPLVRQLPDDWFFVRDGKRVIDHGRYQLDFRNPEVRDACRRNDRTPRSRVRHRIPQDGLQYQRGSGNGHRLRFAGRRPARAQSRVSRLDEKRLSIAIQSSSLRIVRAAACGWTTRSFRFIASSPFPTRQTIVSMRSSLRLALPRLRLNRRPFGATL